MDFPIWLMYFLPLIIVLWMEYENNRNERQRRIINIIKLRRKKGLNTMNDAIKSFIEKECLITTMNSNVIGVVESFEDNWIILRAADKMGGNEIINVDYICRIREYRRNKKGKKKLVAG